MSNNAKFGPGGNSDSFRAAGFRSTLQAPGFVKELGLDAYEYEAGNGITGSDEMFQFFIILFDHGVPTEMEQQRIIG